MSSHRHPGKPAPGCKKLQFIQPRTDSGTKDNALQIQSASPCAQVVPSTPRKGARAAFPRPGKAGTPRHCCGPQGAAQRRPWRPVSWEGIWATWWNRPMGRDSRLLPHGHSNVHLPAGLKEPRCKTLVQPPAATNPATRQGNTAGTLRKHRDLGPHRGLRE